MHDTEHRLENLEIKLMDLEASLGELNAVVIRQASEIDTLQQTQQRLLGQIESLAHPQPGSMADPPPPHY